MSKYTITNTYYDEGLGYSEVKINSKWGSYVASAQATAEDRDVQSEYRGLDFAEYKAYIKLLRGKARAFEERANGVRNAIDIMDMKYAQMDSFAFTGPQKLSLMRIVENLEKQAKRIREQAKTMEDKYPEYCASMLSAKRKIASKYH